MARLESLQFDNSFARLSDAFHTRISPTPLYRPHLACFNHTAAELIELDPAEAHRAEFVDYFNGARILPGADPLAAIYAGHQFGHFVPQLGDGRAVLLGEVRTSQGKRWELQLKGSGQTPYSRSADGRAVLRSTIREYLCSEAMHGLNIPTTRALCIIGSEEEVYRESLESGAMLLRMAPSHLRFGNFELFYYRNQYDELRQLADYAIDHLFPEIADAPNRYLELFREVSRRTAELISRWQLVGFAHGVMNTDNMSLLGLTIDYGPFGFLDSYDPSFICNHSDHTGRYAFAAQPMIARWNVSRLGQALLPLFEGSNKEAAEHANETLSEFMPHFDRHYSAGLAKKLGLTSSDTNDDQLVQSLLKQMQESGCDFTNLFRSLSDLQLDNPNADGPLRDQFIDRDGFDQWTIDYRKRLQAEGSRDELRKQSMDRVNPKYILRNYLAQSAIERAEQGDYSEVDRLMSLLRDPFSEQAEMSEYAALPPDWADTIEVSCSS